MSNTGKRVYDGRDDNSKRIHAEREDGTGYRTYTKGVRYGEDDKGVLRTEGVSKGDHAGQAVGAEGERDYKYEVGKRIAGIQSGAGDETDKRVLSAKALENGWKNSGKRVQREGVRKSGISVKVATPWCVALILPEDCRSLPPRRGNVKRKIFACITKALCSSLLRIK